MYVDVYFIFTVVVYVLSTTHLSIQISTQLSNPSEFCTFEFSVEEPKCLIGLLMIIYVCSVRMLVWSKDLMA